MARPRPEWLTALFTGIIAVTGMWALRFAKGQIREARAEAQVQHLLALDSEYRTEPTVTYRKACAQKRLAGVKEPREETQLLEFFDGVALLANRGYLRDEDVYDRFAWDIFSLYTDDQENIEQERKYDPTNYSNLMLLVPRLETIDDARHGTLAKPTKDDLRDYWNEQLAVGVGTPPSRHEPTSTK